MKARFVAIIIGPIIGAILGFFLADTINNGWFDSYWQMIEMPPVKVQRLVAVDSYSLWIQSDSGILYYNADTVGCKTDCWQEVAEIPVLPRVTPNGSEIEHETITGHACSPAPPLSGVVSQLSQCRITELNWGLHNNYIYALRDDGTIYLWHTDMYTGEGGAIYNYFIFVCGGGLVVFISIFIFALFLGLLDWLAKRAQKDKESTSKTI